MSTWFESIIISYLKRLFSYYIFYVSLKLISATFLALNMQISAFILHRIEINGLIITVCLCYGHGESVLTYSREKFDKNSIKKINFFSQKRRIILSKVVLTLLLQTILCFQNTFAGKHFWFTYVIYGAHWTIFGAAIHIAAIGIILLCIGQIDDGNSCYWNKSGKEIELLVCW